ncbi:MAG: hypothetical protein N2383_03380 [Caldilineales bacterium]|nr:hypothetical protein [Caldilineales bacterium]
MASVRLTTASLIKPLEGASCRRYTAGAAVNAGSPVYLDSSGYIRPCVATAVATNLPHGVALQALAAGERGDVVVAGPVLCLTGATPGSPLYTMDSAGEMDHTGGTKKSIVGLAETATVLFVRPQVVDFS